MSKWSLVSTAPICLWRCHYLFGSKTAESDLSLLVRVLNDSEFLWWKTWKQSVNLLYDVLKPPQCNKDVTGECGIKAPPSLLVYDGRVKSEFLNEEFKWQWDFIMKNIKIIGQSLIRSFGSKAECQSGDMWLSPLYVYGDSTITFDTWQRGQIWVSHSGIWMTVSLYEGQHINNRSISYTKFWDCRSVSK